MNKEDGEEPFNQVPNQTALNESDLVLPPGQSWRLRALSYKGI